MSALRTLPNGMTVVQANQSETDYLYREIFTDRIYLPPGGVSLPENPVVLDVGANIGLFTLFAVREWPGAVVHAFEPVPAVHAILRDNVAQCGDVRVHRLALGATPGTREMSYYPNYTIMSGFDADVTADGDLIRSHVGNTVAELADPGRRAATLAAVDDLLEQRLRQERVRCTVATLSQVLDEQGIDRVDFLKVDVEGAELDVLEGIDAAAWHRVGFAVIEVLDRRGELDGIQRLLREHGLNTRVHQEAAYRGTDLYLVYAARGTV